MKATLTYSRFSKTAIFIFLLVVFICSQLLASNYTSTGNGNWNTPAIWSPAGIPGATDNVIIGHTITLVQPEQITNITINAGSLTFNNQKLTINGEVNGPIWNNLFSNSGSELEIKESATSFNFPSNVINLRKLTINRSTGATTDHTIDLDDAVPADSIVLVLTNGVLKMNSGSKLLLNSFAIQQKIPCSNSTFIDGIISRNIKKSAGMYYYPIGNGSLSRQISIEVTTGGSSDPNTNECNFIYAKPVNFDFIDYSKLPGGITDKFYWNQTKISGANTRRRLYYDISDFPLLTAAQRIANFRLANNDGVPGTNWSIQTTPVTVDDVNKFVEFANSNASNDNFWTLGSNDPGTPMPVVTFKNYSVKYQDSQVKISWEFLGDNDVAKFEILRSDDGENYSMIGSIPFNSEKRVYTFNDMSNKTPKTYYYKIIYLQTNGIREQSPIKAVQVTSSVQELVIEDAYPNPVKKENLKISLLMPENGIVNCTIFNTLGQEVKKFSTEVSAGISTIEVETGSLSRGTYYYNLQYNLNATTGKFLKLKKEVKDSLVTR